MTSTDFIDRIAVQLGQRTSDLLRKNPRRAYSAIVLALAGFGVTAFGVAPLSANVDSTPQRWVTESVTPTNLHGQVLSLSQQDLSLFRNDVTRSSDTVDSLLRRMNVDDPHARAFLRSNGIARELLSGRSGKMVQVRTNGSGELEELIARYPARNAAQVDSHFTRLRLSREGEQFAARLETAPLAARTRMASGTVRNTLFNATDEANLPDSVASQLAEVFSTEINFHRGLRRGDTFSVLYETLTADGEAITWKDGAGRILAAEFVNKGKSHSAIWYEDATGTGKGAYFDFSGRSKNRSFLASPMEFSRITSGFAMRLHPLLQSWRQHAGVDYGAPTGTPVRAVGDGIVEFAGIQSGYGNVVVIKHSGDRSTLYAHLSSIAVRKGERATQGMNIGAVGATGWATGPHLHFEFKVAGIQRDPAEIGGLADNVALNPSTSPQFAVLAKSAQDQLEVAETLSRARRGFE